MSRTDVHRPHRVQQADPHDRQYWMREELFGGRPGGLWPLRNLCGCKLCTGQPQRKIEAKRERAHGRRHLRQVDRRSAADWDVPPRAAW